MKRFYNVALVLALFTFATTDMASAQRGSVRYSGGTSAPVRYQKPMNTPGYSAARSSGSTPSRYQKPMNSGPGTRAYRRASDYYYYPGSPGYTGSSPSSAPIRTSSSPRPASRAPETGTTISRLPRGYQTASLSGTEYYYTQGIYYVKGKLKGTYEAVKPPLGLTVKKLPTGTTQVKTGLYQYRDVYYRPAYDNGELAYVVSNP